jgi:hypothetical protein
MIDIVSQDEDIGLFDTQTTRAANILSVQLGSLEYEPELGIDLKYFLNDEFRFQNESFKSYLVQILANYSINVSSIIEELMNLYMNYTFEIVPAEDNSGLVR